MYPTLSGNFINYDKYPHPDEGHLVNTINNIINSYKKYGRVWPPELLFTVDRLGITKETLDSLPYIQWNYDIVYKHVIHDILGYGNSSKYRRYVLVNEIIKHYFDNFTDKVTAVQTIIKYISCIYNTNPAIYYEAKKILEYLLTIPDVPSIIANYIESPHWLYLPLAELTYDDYGYTEFNINALNELEEYVKSLRINDYIGGDDNTIILYTNQLEFLDRIHNIQKIHNYYLGQQLIDQHDYEQAIKKLLLAGDYADAPELRTKYFWHVYAGRDLMGQHIDIPINKTVDTIVSLGNIIRMNKI